MLSRRLRYRRFVSRIAVARSRLLGGSGARRAGALSAEEFIFRRAPFAECHASSIVETAAGLVATWFGGRGEGQPDVGIWVARRGEAGWSAPEQVAQHHRYPCWNPVLFQPSSGPLFLFYKIGPAPSAWWGMLATSLDGGRTWSAPQRLPGGILGPIKNKPIELPDGSYLSPSSVERDGWRVHLERSTDQGESWERIGPLQDGGKVVAIQPSILTHRDGRLQILCRSKRGSIAESWSRDGGTSWSELRPIGLPNPNSGTDAVSLRDGRHLLVYNHSRRNRSHLRVALSEDGVRWHYALTLEDAMGEYSYPSVIQAADGRVHLTYTWNLCRIKHVVIEPGELG